MRLKQVGGCGQLLEDALTEPSFMRMDRRSDVPIEALRGGRFNPQDQAAMYLEAMSLR